MFDYDQDGWPGLLVANDTPPNKLYRNLRNGKFKDVAVEAGLAFSTEGKARAGMGVDSGDFDGSGKPGVAITNFDNEMIGLYGATAPGVFDDVSIPSVIAAASRNTLRSRYHHLDRAPRNHQGKTALESHTTAKAPPNERRPPTPPPLATNG